MVIGLSLLPTPQFYLMKDFIMEMGVVGGFVVLVLGYAFGRVMQEGISRKCDELLRRCILSDDYLPAIHEFSRRMNKARSDDERTLRKRFLEGALVYFDDGDAEKVGEIDQRHDDFKLYNLTQSHLLNNNVGRLNRFTILSLFHRSIYVISGLGAFLHFYVVYLNYVLGVEFILDPVESVVIAITLLVISFVSFRGSWFFQTKMVDTMIIDFYSSELCD